MNLSPVFEMRFGKEIKFERFGIFLGGPLTSPVAGNGLILPKKDNEFYFVNFLSSGDFGCRLFGVALPVMGWVLFDELYNSSFVSRVFRGAFTGYKITRLPTNPHFNQNVLTPFSWN